MLESPVGYTSDRAFLCIKLDWLYKKILNESMLSLMVFQLGLKDIAIGEKICGASSW